MKIKMIKFLITIAPLLFAIGLVYLLTTFAEYVLAVLVVIAVVGILYIFIQVGLSMANDYEKWRKEREK